MRKLDISIIIPTFNRPRLLGRLLNSVASQTFKKYEVIIVDDHSPQQKAYMDLIRKYKKKIKRLKYFRNETNRGAPYGRNKGISTAVNPLIAFADDDDEWMPEKLAEEVGVFNDRWNEVDLVYTGILFKNGKGRIYGRTKLFYEGTPLKQMLRGKIAIYTSSVLIKKESLLKIGLFDENFPSCQDWELWIRAFSLGCKCFPVKKELVVYHSQDVGITTSPVQYKGMIMLLKKHFYLYARKAPFTLVKLFLAAMNRKYKIRPYLRHRVQ